MSSTLIRNMSKSPFSLDAGHGFLPDDLLTAHPGADLSNPHGLQGHAINPAAPQTGNNITTQSVPNYQTQFQQPHHAAHHANTHQPHPFAPEDDETTGTGAPIDVGVQQQHHPHQQRQQQQPHLQQQLHQQQLHKSQQNQQEPHWLDAPFFGSGYNNYSERGPYYPPQNQQLGSQQQQQPQQHSQPHQTQLQQQQHQQHQQQQQQQPQQQQQQQQYTGMGFPGESRRNSFPQPLPSMPSQTQQIQAQNQQPQTQNQQQQQSYSSNYHMPFTRLPQNSQNDRLLPSSERKAVNYKYHGLSTGMTRLPAVQAPSQSQQIHSGLSPLRSSHEEDFRSIPFNSTSHLPRQTDRGTSFGPLQDRQFDQSVQQQPARVASYPAPHRASTEADFKSNIRGPSAYIGKPVRAERVRKHAVPSKHCHICGKAGAKGLTYAVCCMISSGRCVKSYCINCVRLHKLDTKNARIEQELKEEKPQGAEQERGRRTSAVAPLDCKIECKGWVCPHCSKTCPKDARCFRYAAYTEERRVQRATAKKRRQASAGEV